jgi:hypothetical protein
MMRHWFSTAIVVMLVPLGLWGQAGGPTPFGSGAVPQLSFAGAAAPSNFLSFSLSSATGYNTNIANSGQQTEGDAYVSLGPRIALFGRASTWLSIWIIILTTCFILGMSNTTHLTKHCL